MAKKVREKRPVTPNVGTFNPADRATDELQDPGGAHAKGFVADPPGAAPRPTGAAVPVEPPPEAADASEEGWP